jgi:hypothetical protein
LKITNFEHKLFPRLGLEQILIKSESGRQVILAMSCSINADNFWEQTQNDHKQENYREERIKSQGD